MVVKDRICVIRDAATCKPARTVPINLLNVLFSYSEYNKIFCLICYALCKIDVLFQLCKTYHFNRADVSFCPDLCLLTV